MMIIQKSNVGGQDCKAKSGNMTYQNNDHNITKAAPGAASNIRARGLGIFRLLSVCTYIHFCCRGRNIPFEMGSNRCGLAAASCVALAILVAVGMLLLLPFMFVEATAVAAATTITTANTATITTSSHAGEQAQRHSHTQHLSSPSPLPLSIGDLEMFLYTDGLVHVSYSIMVDTLSPHVVVNLYGMSVDNFVAVSSSGLLLTADVADGEAVIHTFGADMVVVNYDIHDLVSKSGRMWKFEIETRTDFLLHMPHDAVLVGLEIIPNNMIIHDDHALTLGLDSGRTELIYITTGASRAHLPSVLQVAGDEPDDRPSTVIPGQPTGQTILPEPDMDIVMTGAGVMAVAAVSTVTAVAFFVKRAGSTVKNKREQSQNDDTSRPDSGNSSTTEASGAEASGAEATTTIDDISTSSVPPPSDTPNPEEIFLLHPLLREDDKQIVRFIFDHGGAVMESDLRKTFLQPKTTMWRAVKRLERNGIVTTAKKDMQNQVTLISWVDSKPQDNNNNTSRAPVGSKITGDKDDETYYKQDGGINKQ